MQQMDLSTAAWRKSSYSNHNGGDCIEVADGYTGAVPVRDSKDVSRTPLSFSSGAWSAFVDSVK